jgi:hypothetical protein
MKACEVGGITPHIRNLDVRMKIQCRAVLFAGHISNKNLGRPRATVDTWKKRENRLFLLENKPLSLLEK